MSYVDIPDADVDVDSYGREDLVFQQLRDNINAARIVVFPWYWAEVTITAPAPTWTVCRQLFLDIPNLPDFAGIARKFTVGLRAKSSTTDGRVRIREAAGTTGAPVTINNVSYIVVEPFIDIAGSWLGTTRTFIVEGDAGTGADTRIRSIDTVACRLTY